MSRPTTKQAELPPQFQQLLAAGKNALSLDEKCILSQMIRAESKDSSLKLDRFLMGEICLLQDAIAGIEQTQSALRKALERLKGAPWYPGTYLGISRVGSITAALVAAGNSRRAVAVAEEVPLESLRVGDAILLNHEMNILVAKTSSEAQDHGETASFERLLPGRRIVLKWRDEQVVAGVADSLDTSALKNGDLVRWSRETFLALEKLERGNASSLLLEETPSESFAQIGGLDREIGQLLRSLRLHAFHGEKVAKYGLAPKKSVLLAGPPGNGKTMIARALANWLASLSKTGRARFIVVKPAELHSMWYGQSESNYRECFRLAREAGQHDPPTPCVLFLDEIDSVGAVRGSSVTRVNDQVLAALLAELDGLEPRGNVLVVAATNRRDALDPALLRPGRLGDLILEINRPGRKAGGAILEKYLPAGIPYWRNGQGDVAAARAEMIESALARMYSANGESDLATLTFRDEKRRTIAIRDLVSGASIANLAREAIERACQREVETGEQGLRVEDLVRAIDDEFSRAVRALTPANCRRFLTNLPQDVEVVAIEPSTGTQAAAHHYLRMS